MSGMLEIDKLIKKSNKRRRRQKLVEKILKSGEVAKLYLFNVRKEKIMSGILKPVLFLLAMIGAFVFTFVTGTDGNEEQIVAIVASIASVLGFANWRSTFDEFRGFFKSKTIMGAAMTAVPILISIVAVNILGTELPTWLVWAINGLLTIGGGTLLLGMFDAFYKAEHPTNTLKKR